MTTFTHSTRRPVVLSASTESQTYVLFALALGLTVLGVFVGTQAIGLFGTPLLFLCLLIELAIIFTANMWMNVRPFNYILFALFPLLTGFTFTPYIVTILASYVNGAAILLNALIATAAMAGAAAVFARTTSWNLGLMGRALFFGLIGLIIFGLLQIFIPALRGPQFEMIVSGIGIVIFAGFTAYDVQRVQSSSRLGANPFLMALTLYLDIFNLLTYILRFMLALSGERR